MDWIERLKEFANDSCNTNWYCTIVNAQAPDGKPYRPTANVPAMLEEVMELEAAIGYRLPEDLRKIYLEVGNGGFGPGYGLEKVHRNDGLIASYNFARKLRSFDGNVKWPGSYLPICSGGCDLLGVVDLLSERVGFLHYEIGEGIPSEGIDAVPFQELTEWHSPSIKSWFESWMDGKNFMEYSTQFWNDRIHAIVDKHSHTASANPTDLSIQGDLPF
jgi:hypothetical protein